MDSATLGHVAAECLASCVETCGGQKSVIVQKTAGKPFARGLAAHSSDSQAVGSGLRSYASAFQV